MKGLVSTVAIRRKAKENGSSLSADSFPAIEKYLLGRLERLLELSRFLSSNAGRKVLKARDIENAITRLG